MQKLHGLKNSPSVEEPVVIIRRLWMLSCFHVAPPPYLQGLTYSGIGPIHNSFGPVHSNIGTDPHGSFNHTNLRYLVTHRWKMGISSSENKFEFFVQQQRGFLMNFLSKPFRSRGVERGPPSALGHRTWVVLAEFLDHRDESSDSPYRGWGRCSRTSAWQRARNIPWRTRSRAGLASAPNNHFVCDHNGNNWRGKEKPIHRIFWSNTV